MFKRRLGMLILGMLLMVTSFHISFAQNKNQGTIKGKVTTSDGKPAEFVNITIKGTSKGATVGKDGRYSISGINAGNYTLVASFIGLNTQMKEVTVPTGNTVEVDFELKENNQQLNEVIISTNKSQSGKIESDDVAKMSLKNLENPQVYSVVSSELMKDQMTVSVAGALANVPGAVVTTDPAGGTSITLRGFTAEPAARNGVQFIAAGRTSVDPVNVERFEVLKGPSATLFGNVVSSYGGAVNMVTKKPFDIAKSEISYTSGSWGLSRLTADVNAPLNKEKTALLRVNAAVNKQQSFQETGHKNTYTVAPSLTYKASDKLTLNMDVEAYREELTKTPYLQFDVLGVKNVKDIPLGYKETLYGDGIDATANTFRTYFQATYRINDHWTSTTNVSMNNEKVLKSYQFYPTFLDATHIERGIALYGPITTVTTDFQHNLKGDFYTGSIRHRVLWGVDYYHYKSDFSYAFGTIDTIDITNYSKASLAQAEKAIQAGSAGVYNSETETIATYGSDLINITENLMAMLSLRVDRYTLKGTDGYKQTSLTPKFGLIYQVVKDKVSLFGNYMSGFTNNGPYLQPDGAVLTLKPEYAYQWEGGVKVSTLDNKLIGTVSYYDIRIRDAVRYDGSSYAYQDGNQQSSGMEFDLTASPLKGLSITAGYVYNENKYIKATSNEGMQVTGNPRNVANFWASYKFQPGTALNHFGLGFGGNYADQSFYDSDNTIIIPSYVLVNASLFYETAQWRFGIAANNIGNKKYWAHSFTANPQPLRQLLANATFRF
ncbi:TonB-dependent receptor [[Flexibacter] sp. ATCC 35208]|uniref:TonB-dependent receptor n=1 Tax=[Flexibacter] sp. ATCC 35208 TaxID=1936242 RepID=UPI0009F9163D|nr:TonB-dependent receptor [[Flexibacter] sp. ATCC 35208]